MAAGATLFTIDPRPYQAALAQAEAGLARNRRSSPRRTPTSRATPAWCKQDYVTKEQYDQIVANAAALRASLAADQASVDAARLNLAYCTITAPVAGRTGALDDQGRQPGQGQRRQPLVTINQTRPIYVTFTVPGRGTSRRCAPAAPTASR